MSVSEYRCERVDLFNNLVDLNWFRNFVAYQYIDVVFAGEPIRPVLSDYWVQQAHFRYNKDIHLVSNKEYDGQKLNHFKHAGILCYWLRRCPSLTDFELNPDPAVQGKEIRKTLVIYGNVLAAFDIGLRISRFWEAGRQDIPYWIDNRKKIRDFRIPPRSQYIEDICYTLAAKNISPHSLNMLYESLFVNFRP